MTSLRLRQLLATVALAASSMPLASAQTPPQSSPPSPPRKVVHVVAERFAFAPSEIVVEEGTVVEIQLRSDDTNHGFRIKGTSTNVVIPKRGRGTMTVTFEATTAGRYTFECSKMCGAGHSMMKGAIVVKPRETPTAPPPAPPAGGGR
jgi:cytochrome c oxidase subunit II